MTDTADNTLSCLGVWEAFYCTLGRILHLKMYLNGSIQTLSFEIKFVVNMFESSPMLEFQSLIVIKEN